MISLSHSSLPPPSSAPAPPDPRLLVAEREDQGSCLTLSGTTEPHVLVTITWPDGSCGSVAANHAGDWQLQTRLPQPGGTLRVTATDERGHTSIPRLSYYDDQ